MMNRNHIQIAKVTRIIGRVVGTISTLLFVTWLTYATFFAGNMSIDFGTHLYVITMVIVLISIFLAYRNELIAGCLFLLVSLGVLFIIIIYMSILSWLIVGMPFLIAGITLIISWWFSTIKHPNINNNSGDYVIKE